MLNRTDGLYSANSDQGANTELTALHATGFQIAAHCRLSIGNFGTRLDKYESAMGSQNGRSILVQLKTLETQLKSALTKLLLINVATYSSVLTLQNSLPSRLERSLLRDFFMLEDAIGKISPVHLQFVNSWEALDAVLETRFRGIQGHDRVACGDFVL